jgi:hypothetical protein
VVYRNSERPKPFFRLKAGLRNFSRSLALKSWSVFVAKEGLSEDVNQCDEDDPDLLAALDEAVAQADTLSHAGYSGEEVRARISEWTSK